MSLCEIRLTTKDDTDILRSHEVHSGMLSHSVQMQHERAQRVVVILWQFIDRKPHSCVLVGWTGDACLSALVARRIMGRTSSSDKALVKSMSRQWIR